MGKKSEGIRTVFEIIEIGSKLFSKKGKKR